MIAILCIVGLALLIAITAVFVECSRQVDGLNNLIDMTGDIMPDHSDHIGGKR